MAGPCANHRQVWQNLLALTVVDSSDGATKYVDHIGETTSQDIRLTVYLAGFAAVFTMQQGRQTL